MGHWEDFWWETSQSIKEKGLEKELWDFSYEEKT